MNIEAIVVRLVQFTIITAFPFDTIDTQFNIWPSSNVPRIVKLIWLIKRSCNIFNVFQRNERVERQKKWVNTVTVCLITPTCWMFEWTFQVISFSTKAFLCCVVSYWSSAGTLWFVAIGRCRNMLGINQPESMATDCSMMEEAPSNANITVRH